MCKTHHRALLYVVRPAADKRRSARTPGIHVHRRGKRSVVFRHATCGLRREIIQIGSVYWH